MICGCEEPKLCDWRTWRGGPEVAPPPFGIHFINSVLMPGRGDNPTKSLAGSNCVTFDSHLGQTKLTIASLSFYSTHRQELVFITLVSIKVHLLWRLFLGNLLLSDALPTTNDQKIANRSAILINKLWRLYARVKGQWPGIGTLQYNLQSNFHSNQEPPACLQHIPCSSQNHVYCCLRSDTVSS